MYNGVFVVNKPKGFSSHDVIAKLRGIMQERRIGHSGTLDPMATGVLPIFIGYATKASDFEANKEKEYIATLKLGIETDTLDITGDILREEEVNLEYSAVEKAVLSFKGKQQQKPPMYSAVQVDGRRLYDLARQGIEVERKARDIEILEIELLSFENNEAKIRVLATKGTYIRVICADIGTKLGTFATMTELLRTKSGKYTLDMAYTLDEVQEIRDTGNVGDIIISTDTVFMDYPRCDIDDYGYQRGDNGAFIPLKSIKGLEIKEGTIARVYYNNEFIMLGKIDVLDKGGLAMFTYKRFF